MAGIIGLAELLTLQDLGEENNDTTRGIFDASKRLLQILNDVLDASKLEAGKVTIEEANFPVRTLVAEVKQLILPAAQKKNIAINATCDEQVPEFVFGDELRVRQILLNLAFNAVKFTKQGSVDISDKARLAGR